MSVLGWYICGSCLFIQCVLWKVIGACVGVGIVVGVVHLSFVCMCTLKSEWHSCVQNRVDYNGYDRAYVMPAFVCMAMISSIHLLICLYKVVLQLVVTSYLGISRTACVRHIIHEETDGWP